MDFSSEQRVNLKTCLKNDELINLLVDSDESKVVNFLIDELVRSRSEVINFHNKRISESINFFVRKGEWANLSQIMKSLPEEIIKTPKDDDISRIVDMFANQVEEFMELPEDTRQKALEYINESKEN